MSNSVHLSLPYIAPQQAQKHVPYNEALSVLDAIVHLAVVDRDRISPPAAPAEGDRHIVAAGANDAWSGRDSEIALWRDGAWTFLPPQLGWRAWDAAEARLVIWDGTSWAENGGASINPASFVGVNATADSVNRLSVASPASLFSHEGAGCQVKVNKNASTDTGALLFQTGFSGRAEIGLVGDDNLSIKVSADGTAFSTALAIDRNTGRVGIGGQPTYGSLHVAVSDSGASPVGVADDVVIENTEDAGLSFLTPTAKNAHLIHATPLDQDSAEIEFVGSTRDISLKTIAVEQMRLFGTGGVTVGAPAGGAKGVGAINAQAVYDDNMLLSCYVFDQVLDGEIDEDKWDAKTPAGFFEVDATSGRDPQTDVETVGTTSAPRRERGKHLPMRRFKNQMKSAYDPLTLDGYANHWRDKRHLHSLPDEAGFDVEAGLPMGDWLQRLVETVEIQAVLIEQLNARTKALEAVRSDVFPR